MKAIMHTFDTHKHIKELQATGFDERQAEVIVKSLLESRDYDVSKLVTKEQFSILERDVQSLRVEMKEEFQAVRTEMKEESHSIRAELKKFVTKDEFYSYVKSETTAVKNDILKWMVPLLLAIMLQLFLK